jgi:hypothetical protein
MMMNRQYNELLWLLHFFGYKNGKYFHYIFSDIPGIFYPLVYINRAASEKVAIFQVPTAASTTVRAFWNIALYILGSLPTFRRCILLPTLLKRWRTSRLSDAISQEAVIF